MISLTSVPHALRRHPELSRARRPKTVRDFYVFSIDPTPPRRLYDERHGLGSPQQRAQP
jgi:hypothetical protein